VRGAVRGVLREAEWGNPRGLRVPGEGGGLACEAVPDARRAGAAYWRGEMGRGERGGGGGDGRALATQGAAAYCPCMPGSWGWRFSASPSVTEGFGLSL